MHSIIDSAKKSYPIVVVLLLLLAAGARTVYLDQVPPALFIDEYNLAVPAAKMVLGLDSVPLFGFGWYATPGMFFYYLAGFFKIFGVSIHAIQFAWLLPTLLALPVLYYFSTKLFQSRMVQMTALILFALNVPIISIARWGHGAVVIAFLELCSLTLLWRAHSARTKQSVILVLLASISAGIGVQLYVGARPFLLLFPLFYIWYVRFGQQSLGHKLKSVFVSCLTIMLCLAPLFMQLKTERFSVIWRMQEVSIINPSGSIRGNVAAVVHNAAIYGGALFGQIDPNLRHNPTRTAVFPYLLGVFVPVGLIWLLLQRRTRKHGLFLLIALITTSAGGLLSAEAPSYFRMYGVIPILILILAYGVVKTVGFLVQRFVRTKQLRFMLQLSIVPSLIAVLSLSVWSYFQQLRSPNGDIAEAFSYPEQQIAEVVSYYHPSNQPVILDRDFLYSSTIFFVLPDDAIELYQQFDIDALAQLSSPTVLILDHRAVGLEPLLNQYFDVTNRQEIDTRQAEKPVVYEIAPRLVLPDEMGLQLRCRTEQGAELEQRSLGIDYSFGTFPQDLSDCTWFGALHISESGSYQIHGRADDSLSLQLTNDQGKVVLDQDAAPDWQQSIELQAGEYEFFAGYRNLGGARSASLVWRRPGSDYDEVINPQLFHILDRDEE